MRSLFHPDGKLIPTGRTSAGQHVVRPMTVEEYISGIRRVPVEDSGLPRGRAGPGTSIDSATSHRSSAATPATGTARTQPFVRGINSIQLYNDDIRWWVMNVFWEPEGPGVPLPPRYEGAGGASEPRADG
jgi:hypothetical protein